MLDRLGASPGIVRGRPLVNIRRVPDPMGVPVGIEGHRHRRPTGHSSRATGWPHRIISALAGIPTLPAVTSRRLTTPHEPGVAIVSRDVSRRFWNGTDVVGRHLKPEFPTEHRVLDSSRETRSAHGGRRRRRFVKMVSRCDWSAAALSPYAQNPTIVVTPDGSHQRPSGRDGDAGDP